MVNKMITELPGIGEKRAELFKKRGIRTLSDLLYFFPRSHEDRTKFKNIAGCAEGEDVCIKARVARPVEVFKARKGMTVSTMVIRDDSDALNIVWYNNRFVKDAYHAGEEYVFFGKIIRDKYGKR